MAHQFPYADHQVLHFVRASKTIQCGKLEFKEFDSKYPGSKIVRVYLQSAEIKSAVMELTIKATDTKDIATYHAALLLDAVRIRGVDFNRSKQRTYKFKVVIPTGWHQNVDYPNHQKDNRHDALDLGKVTDLDDFSRKVCGLWNIEFPEPDSQRRLF